MKMSLFKSNTNQSSLFHLVWSWLQTWSVCILETLLPACTSSLFTFITSCASSSSESNYQLWQLPVWETISRLNQLTCCHTQHCHLWIDTITCTLILQHHYLLFYTTSKTKVGSHFQVSPC